MCYRSINVKLRNTSEESVPAQIWAFKRGHCSRLWLGSGIILFYCVWLCAWSRVQRYRYRLLPFTTLLPTHCLGAVGGEVTTFHHPPADHCSLVVGPCSTRLTHHLAHIWLYSNDPSTMPLLTLPFYISNDFLFSAALLAGEQLAWRRGPRLDNDEIKFQK